jgi:Methyltransferase domain
MRELARSACRVLRAGSEDRPVREREAMTTVLLVVFGVAAVTFAVLWLQYRNRLYAETGRDPGYPIRTIALADFDPVFAEGPFGPTLDAEVSLVGKGPAVTGGTSNTESWVLGALARRARTIFEFGTATGRTAYVFARNALPDARVHTLTLHPGDVASYTDAPGDHAKAASIARRESRFASFLYTGTDVEDRIEQLFGDSKAFDHARFIDACDLVFVDGSHARSYVESDTAKALEMVRPGGIVLWHDYKGARGAGRDVFRVLNDLRHRLPLARLHGTSIVAYRRPAD